MTYVEIVNKVNRIFPSTVDCDYRDVPVEELWRKVYNLIEKLNLIDKFDGGELAEIRESLANEQKKNFHRKNIVEMNRGSSYNYGFNQNNYVIKQSVLRMKGFILNRIIDKGRFRYDLISDEYDFYNSNMGAIKEIEIISNFESIKEYLTKLLTITKEDNDFYRFEVSLFTKDILLNYGYNPNSTELFEMIDTITKKVEGILFSSNNYNDAVYDDSSRVNKKLIQELADYISLWVKKNLQNRKREEFSPNPNEDETQTSKQGRQDIVELLQQNKEQEELVARNKKILEEIRRIDEKRNQLLQELADNNARMVG